MNLWQNNKKILSSLVVVVIVINIAGGVLFAPKPAEAGYFYKGLVITAGIAGVACYVSVVCAGAVVAGGGALAVAAGSVKVLAGTVAAVSATYMVASTADTLSDYTDGSWFSNLFASLGSVVFSIVNYIYRLITPILNGIISYSLDTTLMPLDTIQKGWSIVVSVSNIFFIFILVYISISTILGLAAGSTYKMLGKLILVALLINFSLVFTKVVIDATNIVARQFWVSSSTVNKDGEPPDIAGTIAQAYNLGNIIAQTEAINKDIAGKSGKDVETVRSSVKLGAMQIGLMYFMVSAFILVTCYVIGYAAILFIIRFVKLLVIMVLAPLAFVGAILPGTEKYSKEWWGTLSGEALVAPAFLFFIYLSISMITGGDSFLPSSTFSYDQATMFLIANEIPTNHTLQTTLQNVAIVFFRFALITALLLASIEVAKKLAGESAKMASGLAGLAFGTGIGVAAYTGRKTIGRFGQAAYEGLADKNFRGAATLRSFADTARKGSYDIRNATVVGGALESAAQAAGMTNEKAIGFSVEKGGFYTKQGVSAGGFKKESEEERAKKETQGKELRADERRIRTDRAKAELNKPSMTQEEYNAATDDEKKAFDTSVQKNLELLNQDELLTTVGDNMSDSTKTHVLRNLNASALKTINEKGNLDDANKKELRTIVVANATRNPDGQRHYRQELRNERLRDSSTAPAIIQADLKQLTREELLITAGTDMSDTNKKHILENLNASQLKTVNEFGSLSDDDKKTLRTIIESNSASNPSGAEYYNKERETEEIKKKIDDAAEEIQSIINHGTGATTGNAMDGFVAGNLTNEILTKLPTAIITNPKFAEHLGSSQLAALQRSGALETAIQRGLVKSAVLSGANQSGKNYMNSNAGKLLW